VRVEESQSGGNVALARGDQLEVALAESAGTGYRWHVERDGAPVCRLAGARFEPGAPRPGAPGRRVFTFEVATPGKAQITIESRRLWEPARPPSRRFELGVEVL
jgi:predicted secreted protein